jgi:hypothetical protein
MRAGNPFTHESVGSYGRLVRTTPGRSRLPSAISGFLLIVIASATGATVAFSRGGGIVVGVLALDCGKKLSW